MASAIREKFGRFVLLFCALAAGAGVPVAVQARGTGIPKSAPAFTKFVEKFIQEAMPTAKVNAAGRLRLDVETPDGGHDTDLHNIYSFCQRNPDTCIVEMTTFVGDMVQLYKSNDVLPTRQSLRVVIRPSAYLAPLRSNPKRNRPLAAPLAGDYWIIVVKDQPTTIGYMDESELPPLKLNSDEAFAVAESNTRNALAASLQKELASGSCRGMLAGDLYVSSALAFPDLWRDAAHRCDNNLLVATPASDVVIYCDGTKEGALKSIIRAAHYVMARDEKPFSDAVFRWSTSGWIPVPPPPPGAK